MERRDDSPVGQGSLHRTPPIPAPSEDRLFTHWSSLESLHARTSPQSVPIRETGLDINQPVNQIAQPGSEPDQIGATGNTLCTDRNISSPRTHQQLDELGVRMIDMGTNTSDVEVRPHRDGARVITSDANARASLPIVDVMIPSGWEDQVAIPQINLSVLGYGPNLLRDSQMETPAVGGQEISILLQLDWASVCTS